MPTKKPLIGAAIVGQSGGPSSVINASAYGVIKTALEDENITKVYGAEHGIVGVLEDRLMIMDEEDPAELERLLYTPSSALGSCRYKIADPSDNDKDYKRILEIFEKYNVRYFFYIGGNDSMDTCAKISRYMAKVGYECRVIGVPKTIDNDLPLPKGTPTFGYESAKDKGAVIARAVYVDARTSGNWFVLAAMGRSAGHLAFGIGEACHYPMIVIPEMFDKTEITVEKIVNLVISSIIKRKIMGMDYGAAVISEGVFHALSDEEIRKSGIHFTYDEHGHPELGKVSKAHIFNEMIEKKVKELGIKVKSRPVELGYEIRCQTPIAYDLTYCSELGIGVHKLFAEGKTGCMVYVDSEGNVSPLYLKDLQDPTTGKIPPRLVDIKSDKFSSVVETILNAITPADYEAAKQYVPNPEEYDFHKILNWK